MADIEGYKYIDPEKLSIPAEIAIFDELENALSLFKKQQDQLYNFSVSPDFKQIEESNKADTDKFNASVNDRMLNTFNLLIDTFKLIDMKGGGWFDFFTKKPTKVTLSNFEILLDHLTDSVSSEKLKFNGILNNIKLYTFNLKNDKQKADLILDTIHTKIATFDVIVNEIISIIKKNQQMLNDQKNLNEQKLKDQKMPSTGGRKRKTHRKKRSVKTTKSRRL